MKKLIFLVLLVLTLGLLPVAGQATISTYNDRDSWEAAVTNFLEVDLASQVAECGTLYAPNPDNLPQTLSLPYGDTLSFNIDLEGRQVGGEYCPWATWSGGNVPRVLDTGSSIDTTGTLWGNNTVTGTFSGPQWGFGLEMEPNIYETFNMTLTLYDSNGNQLGIPLSQAVEGYEGAAFFGWTGGEVVSMTLSADFNSNGDPYGFAFGRMVQAVPVPASVLLLGSGLAGLGLLRARKRFKG